MQNTTYAYSQPDRLFIDQKFAAKFANQQLRKATINHVYTERKRQLMTNWLNERIARCDHQLRAIHIILPANLVQALPMLGVWGFWDQYSISAVREARQEYKHWLKIVSKANASDIDGLYPDFCAYRNNY